LRGRDGFLLSVDDFAAALTQRWVLLELMSKPGVLLFAVGHSPLFKPLYAAFLTLKSISTSWARHQLEEVHARLPLNLSFRPLNDSFKPWEGGGDGRKYENVSHYNRRSHYSKSSQVSKESTKDTVTKERQNYETAVKQTGQGDDLSTPAKKVYKHTETTAGRKLLQTGGTVQTLQSQTDIKFAETWLAGPFTWPPPFYMRLTSQCNLATAMLQIAHDLISVLTAYYSGAYVTVPEPPKGIWDNLPNLKCSTDMKPVQQTGGVVSSIYHSIWSITGIDPGYVREFFSKGESTNIFTISTSMLKCDFQAVTYCTKHRKDLLASVVLILIFYVIFYNIAKAINLSSLATILIMSVGFPSLVLWYSYGMAFTCTPMLPTCLMDDLIYILNTLLPLQVSFPEELQTSPDCLGDASKDSCLKRCSDPPVSFEDWRDTLAFGVCYTSKSLCVSLAKAIGNKDTLSTKMYANSELLVTASPTRINALIFCFGVTFVNVIPVLLLIVVGITVSVYLLYLPCVFIPRLIGLIGQYLVYLHTKSNDD
jgi:hypothetical protein